MDNNKTWKVYMHTLPKEISGYQYDKRYIGVTTEDLPRKRWRLGSKYKFNKIFYSDIEKFGWDNITHEVLAIWDNEIDGFESEQRFIELLDCCTPPKKGYNISSGGKGPFGLVGEKNSNYGHKHSLTTRQKMSESHADFKLGNNPRARKVYQFNSNYEFIKAYDSIQEIPLLTNYCKSNINRALKYHQCAYKYFWAYEQDVIVSDNKIELKIRWNMPSKGEKEVYQFNKTGNVFIAKYSSCSEAGRITGIEKMNIAKAARDGNKKVHLIGGYQWRYSKDVYELSDGYRIAN